MRPITAMQALRPPPRGTIPAAALPKRPPSLVRFLRAAALLVTTLAIAGSCASLPPRPINDAASPMPPARQFTPPFHTGEDAIGLAFSGGGARAAAFSYGVLLGLAEARTPDGQSQIDNIAFITAVSGGTYTASWFGLHGAEGLPGFREALLNKNWQGAARTNLLSPANWIGAVQGGVNGPREIAGWLDREVFNGARLSDMRGPPILLNAADLRAGVPFAFAAPWFDALCSDLGSIRIADAVAAASAYPVGIRPVLLEAYPENCATPSLPWAERLLTDPGSSTMSRATAATMADYHAGTGGRYLHLLDGGLVDNFGLTGLSIQHEASSLPYGPLLTAEDAVRIRRLRIIVVNAEQVGGPVPADEPRGPGGARLIQAVAGHTVDAAKYHAYDAFAGKLKLWEDETVAWRCALSVAEAKRLGAPDGWNCAGLTFSVQMIGFADLPPARAASLGSLPTRLSLPAADIDLAIEAGRDLALERARMWTASERQMLATTF